MKIANAAFTALALIGIACGGGSNWSAQDKTELETGLTAGATLGFWTAKQSRCLSDWMQENFDSLEEANAAEGDEEMTEAYEKCGVDKEKMKNFASDVEDLNADIEDFNSKYGSGSDIEPEMGDIAPDARVKCRAFGTEYETSADVCLQYDGEIVEAVSP